VTHLQDRRPAAVFYPFGYPTPYVYEKIRRLARMEEQSVVKMAKERILTNAGAYGL
jgi:hypothetical protein